MSAHVEPVVRTLTQAQIQAYADASGDQQPAPHR
jgi:acyl dehydratase